MVVSSSFTILLKKLMVYNLIYFKKGILGLCAIVNAYPYDVPTFLPECVTYLCEFINDTNPIQVNWNSNLKQPF